MQMMDMFVEQTHEIRHQWRNNEKAMRFTDTRLDEQARGVSLKMVPMSLVMQGASGKSYLFNLIDTPGNSPSPPWRVTESRGVMQRARVG
jgi:116 kDa U5 small nuclear ribonucleoprotein component